MFSIGEKVVYKTNAVCNVEAIETPVFVKEKNKKYYDDHKAEICEKSRNYYQAHKAEISARRKQQYKERKEKTL